MLCSDRSTVHSQGGAASLFGFTGEQADPNGQLYLRARTYDPAMGRFTSADTVQPDAPGSQGYNRYAYVANNPATWTDPSGHQAEQNIQTAGLGLVNAVLGYALYSIQQASRQVVVGNTGSILTSSRELTRFALFGPIITALQGVVGGATGALLGPDFISRALGAVIYVISMTLAVTMLYVLFSAFVLIDPFDFFPDTRAPSEIVTYASETVATAGWYYPHPPEIKSCSLRTALSGASEELLWAVALWSVGMGSGPASDDILFGAGWACFTQGSGGGGSGGGGPRFPKWISDIKEPYLRRTAELIEMAYPGLMVQGSERQIYRADGTRAGDFDVELPNLNIEVTGGNGKGKLAQATKMSNHQAALGREVVVFGEKIGGSATRGLEGAGFKVFRNPVDLLEYIGRKHGR